MGLYVDSSSMGGDGLFVDAIIRKRSTVVQYGGSLTPVREAEKDNYNSRYCHEVHVDWVRDAIGETTYLGRFVNDGIRVSTLNAKFVVDEVNLTVSVVAIKDIAAGEEVLASYGNDYWYNWYHYRCLSNEHRRLMYNRASPLVKWWIDQQDFN